MRTVTKDIQLTIDGSPLGFRLTKLDAFSGVMLLRLLMRLEEKMEACKDVEKEDRPGLLLSCWLGVKCLSVFSTNPKGLEI